jgi:hypothetical protein
MSPQEESVTIIPVEHDKSGRLVRTDQHGLHGSL